MLEVERVDTPEAILPYPLQNALTRPLRNAAAKRGRGDANGSMRISIYAVANPHVCIAFGSENSPFRIKRSYSAITCAPSSKIIAATSSVSKATIAVASEP
jgi:hypothetical protein